MPGTMIQRTSKCNFADSGVFKAALEEFRVSRSLEKSYCGPPKSMRGHALKTQESSKSGFGDATGLQSHTLKAQ